ncbi:UDP-N-acetylmuramoyl-L-alanyl-D-glutamate--2,6-diaminopimelate ligase [Candidatus Saccharibacteria bacterium]|nr:UDP-N-acetylmuramoyl-L-alanyl-D-glutamate--2,6-diaminopimelate ligase [Candidatus Saccharibacteria bacterium]
MATIRKLVKKLIPTTLFKTVEPWGHLVEAVLVNIRFGFPSRGMHIIGVTGTNGKTTTSFMIQKMLSQAGIKTALMTTVAYGVDSEITAQVAHMTTASAPLLQKRLRDFKRQGVEWVVLETTSHALAQHRVWGIPYEIAVMTNITHEHLDYHGTFERYLTAKLRLFKLAARRGKKFGVVNADDPSAKVFTDATPRSITYGVTAGELKASHLKLESDGCRYEATIDSDTYNIHCNIPGEFNVYNSLAAVAVGRELGLSKQQIEQGIESLDGVEGRMTVVDEGQLFTVVVDFAHTPDSFERLLRDVRKATKGKLVTVFGSAGQRDEAKRAIQGEIAGRYSDEVVLTEEDDRDVDGHQILDQIAGGAQTAGKTIEKDLFLILDREEAIGFALTRVKAANDTVILLGKGHEKTIERADGEYPWNEVEITKTALQALRTEDTK